jgi:hypothetical protein
MPNVEFMDKLIFSRRIYIKQHGFYSRTPIDRIVAQSFSARMDSPASTYVPAE